MVRLILLAVLLALSGCANLMRSSDQGLKPFVGKWVSTGPQMCIIVVSSLDIQASGRFVMNTLIIGAKESEIELTGTCSTNKAKIILQVQTNSEKTEHKFPAEIQGVLEDGFLIMHDDPVFPDNTTRYKRM